MAYFVCTCTFGWTGSKCEVRDGSQPLNPEPVRFTIRSLDIHYSCDYIFRNEKLKYFNHVSSCHFRGALWIIDTDRNIDREEMGCTKLFGSFDITPKPGHGLRPIVPLCSHTNPCSCLGPGSTRC